MTGWTGTQFERLLWEAEILKKRFSAARWANPNEPSCAFVTVPMRTNAQNWYSVVLLVPQDFPNSVPRVVVVKPNPLRSFRGVDLRNCWSSGEMHLFEARGELPLYLSL